MQTVDASGQSCNVLHQGEAFSVVLTYHADEAIKNLEVACSITDKAGLLITGQRFPELEEPLTAQGRHELQRRFRFRPASNQGSTSSTQGMELSGKFICIASSMDARRFCRRARPTLVSDWWIYPATLRHS